MKRPGTCRRKRAHRFAWIAGAAFGMMAGCGPGPKADLRIVEGVLERHDPGVKSPEAWAGHEFTVDGVPVLPSEAVSREALAALVGRRLRVRGTWEEGQAWLPGPGVDRESRPVVVRPDGTEDMPVRGGGVRAATAEPLSESPGTGP
jgi:hypothetical protein